MKNAAIIIALFVATAIPPAIIVFYGMHDLRALTVHDVDLAKLTDGTYSGSYHKGRWTYDVEVRVRDHRLVSILNVNPRMNAIEDWNAKAAAAMIAKQAVHIDVVSGATLNTKAFGKAVEIALSSPVGP